MDVPESYCVLDRILALPACRGARVARGAPPRVGRRPSRARPPACRSGTQHLGRRRCVGSGCGPAVRRRRPRAVRGRPEQLGSRPRRSEPAVARTHPRSIDPSIPLRRQGGRRLAGAGQGRVASRLAAAGIYRFRRALRDARSRVALLFFQWTKEVSLRVLVTGHNGYIGSVLVPMLDGRPRRRRPDSDLFAACTFGDDGRSRSSRSTPMSATSRSRTSSASTR